MLTITSKNILDYSNCVIFQVVNCKGAMGAGLAAQIRAKWPDVYTEYKRYIENTRHYYIDKFDVFDSSFLLGHFNLTHVNRDTIVVNLFAQDAYGTRAKQLCYRSLIDSLQGFEEYRDEIIGENGGYNCKFYEHLVFPENMGCGLAGGDWKIVENILRKTFDDSQKLKYIGADENAKNIGPDEHAK